MPYQEIPEWLLREMRENALMEEAIASAELAGAELEDLP